MLISHTMKDFDSEIVEAHHNKKKDMPSGTAKTLKSDVLEATGKNDIPVHSLRAGNIVGEHEIVFAHCTVKEDICSRSNRPIRKTVKQGHRILRYYGADIRKSPPNLYFYLFLCDN